MALPRLGMQNYDCRHHRAVKRGEGLDQTGTSASDEHGAAGRRRRPL